MLDGFSYCVLIYSVQRIRVYIVCTQATLHSLLESKSHLMVAECLVIEAKGLSLAGLCQYNFRMIQYSLLIY